MVGPQPHQLCGSWRNQGDAADPRAPLSGNFRPIQALNGRTIRTNIFQAPAEEKEDSTQCPTIQENVEYKCKKHTNTSSYIC